MNYLVIDKSIIIKNIGNIKKILNKDGTELYLMVKSNLYGYGYKLINYIDKYIDGIVIKDSSVLNQITNINKTVIKLYDCKKIDNVSNCILILNNSNKLEKNSFLRVDPFLGLHGITFEQLKKIENLKLYKGILIYVNEYLTEQEFKILKDIVKIVNDNNLILNIGGSTVLNNINSIYCERKQVRLLRKILFSETQQSSMYLECTVLNKVFLNNENFTIGFKSDRKIYNKGYLYLVSIGYDDFKLLPIFYKNNIKIKILNDYYDIACYPCMNTMWIYSLDKEIGNEVLCLFDNTNDIKNICKKLDIDQDEFYSSYSLEIQRKYI